MLHEPGETQASDNKAWEPELAAEKQPSLKCFSTPPPRNPLPTPQLHKYALSVFKRLSAQISQCVKSAPVRVCMCEFLQCLPKAACRCRECLYPCVRLLPRWQLSLEETQLQIKLDKRQREAGKWDSSCRTPFGLSLSFTGSMMNYSVCVCVRVCEREKSRGCLFSERGSCIIAVVLELWLASCSVNHTINSSCPFAQ